MNMEPANKKTPPYNCNNINTIKHLNYLNIKKKCYTEYLNIKIINLNTGLSALLTFWQ